MKRSVLFLVSLLVVATMVAAPVSQQRAMQVAQQFIPVPDNQAQAPGMRAENQPANIVYTHPMPKSGRPAFYVVNVGGSFVIVSADDVAHQVLGYNLGKNWPVAANGEVQLPPQVKSFFDDLAAQMEAAIEADPNHAPDADWSQPQSAPRRRMMSEMPDSVGPLLTTTWDQGQYYNALCPEDQNSPYNGHCPTGCVATAMAQIINYWGYPVHGRGIHSYDTNYGNLTVNYDSARYDFAHMPAQLTDSSSPQEIQAVATLMRDCGVAVNMSYETYESGALAYDLRGALVNFFTFSPKISYMERNRTLTDDWERIIKKDIFDGHPILYSGNGNFGGHLFICDGYNRDYYHFNFGWNGYFDGWFLLSMINPTSNSQFNWSQSAVLNIYPDSISEHTTLYSQYKGGQHDYFMVSQYFDVRNIMADNYYSFENNESNFEGHILSFIPSDSTKQIMLFVMDDVMLDVHFYDGVTTDSLIRSFENAGGYYYHIDTSYIITTRHALTVKIENNSLIKKFHFLVIEDNGCERVAGLTATSDTTAVHLSWNNTEAMYQVEYGNKGFRHGEGQIIITENNSISISGIPVLKEYDFYVRQICDTNLFGPWSMPKTIAITRPYWTDVVMNQPEGYIEDEEGDIHISSAEGLAWLAQVTSNRYLNNPNRFEGRLVSLESDIDLGQFLWNPIERFSGTFDGRGHSINNLTSIGDSNHNAGGLIGVLQNGEVKNVIMSKCRINSPYATSAGIVSSAENSLIGNCFVDIEIQESPQAAGIVSGADNTMIINCATHGKIASRYHTAGICSTISNGKILNCYSSVSLNPGTPHLTAGICAWNPQSEVSNCYSNYHRSGNFPVSEWTNEAFCSDLAFFGEINEEWVIVNQTYKGLVQDSIFFEDKALSNFLEIMNNGVEKYNIQGLKLWRPDSTGLYGGLPILSNEEYVPTCSNISDFRLRNVNRGNTFGVEISWNEDSVIYDHCEVRYGKLIDEGLHWIDTILYTDLYNNPDTLWELEEGENYLFKIRSFCDSIHHSAWSDEKSIVFDRSYWTEIITVKPDGYIVDEEGNIFISSAEGVAWLCSVINGLNGQKSDSLFGRTVTLLSDVNMGAYKWTPMICFSGSFNGMDHFIDSIYVNETADYSGFFSKIENGQVKNTHFTHSRVNGHEYAGIICGKGLKLKLSNCYADGIVYAFRNAGGLVGTAEAVQINNCHTNGIIQAGYNNAGGFAGALYGNISLFDESYLHNCYSNCTVTANNIAGIISGTMSNMSIRNSYANGVLNSFMWSGGVVGDCNGLDISNLYTTMYSPEDVGYTVNGEAPIGTIAGYNYSIMADHTYFPAMSGIPLVGTNYTLYDYGSITFIDTAAFSIESSSHPFVHSGVTIANNHYQSLLSALNAWVDAYDTAGVYRHWVADTTMVNGGYPVFAPIPIYVVKFQNHDGTILQIDTLQRGSTPEYRGETPTKTSSEQYAYFFVGWSPDLSWAKENAIYTAKYDSVLLAQCTVVFQNYDGTILQIDTLVTGSVPEYRGLTPYRENTEAYTYSFMGWSPSIIPVIGDVIYTAVYSEALRKYVIIFLDEDSTLLQRDTLDYGIMPVYRGVIPQKEGTMDDTYRFAGWDKEIVPVNGDAIYIAIYELVPKAGTDTYEYPTLGDYGEYSLSSKWLYSNTLDNFRGNEPGGHDYVRGMAVNDGKMYFVDREHAQLTIVDGATGKMLEPLPLVGSAFYQNVQIPFNDVQFDNAGHCLITACSRGEQRVVVHQINLETGVASTLINERIHDNPRYSEDSWRIDAFDVYGDVTDHAIIMFGNSMNADLHAAYKWEINNGVAGPAERVDLIVSPDDDSYLWRSDSTLSTENISACRVHIVDDNHFYWDHHSCFPTLFSMDGTLAGDLKSCPTGMRIPMDNDTITMNYGHNGVCEFRIGEENFLIMAATNNLVRPASSYAIFKFTDQSKSFSSLVPMWFLPKDGMGIATNGPRVAVPAVEVHDTVATIYLYTQNNGYGVYEMVSRPKCTIVTHADSLQGQIIGGGTYLKNTEVHLVAVPKEGYNFVQWSDGCTDIERTILLSQDTSMTALFEIQRFTIVFRDEDSTLLQVDTLEYGTWPEYRGTSPIKASTAQYTYTFAGWSPVIASVTGNAVYEARYTATVNKYIIMFLNEDSTLLQIDTLAYGAMPEFHGATPIKQATAQYTYTFNGWNNAVVSVTGDAMYVATYVSMVNKYVVMFLNEDSTLLQIDTLAYGAMPEYRGATPTKQATAQYTYTFNGWNNAIVSVTGDAMYVATFVSTVNKYVVTFRDEDNTLLQRDTLEYGALPAYRGTTPTKQSTAEHTYTFAGWDPSVVSVIGNATYTATYNSVVNKYVVMFLNEDSTLLQIDTLAYGAMPEYRGATPAKQATAQYTYTFNGWNNAIVSVTGDVTYLATYVSTTNKYLIIFQDEDGTPLQQDSVEYGALPAYRGTTPTKQSTAEYTYTFAGWNPSIASVIGDATYTATYYSVVNKYVITFQNEDGTILQRDTLDYGVIPVYREANPTKESTAEATFTFVGWAPSISAVAEDAVYTATYDSVVNTYVIIFLNEDSTLLQIDTLQYGAMPEYRGEEPVKPNEGDYFYIFTGWEPEVVPVVGDAIYVATYESHGTGLDNVAEKQKPVKVMEDGKLYILMPDGTKYSATGKKVE